MPAEKGASLSAGTHTAIGGLAGAVEVRPCSNARTRTSKSLGFGCSRGLGLPPDGLVGVLPESHATLAAGAVHPASLQL